MSASRSLLVGLPERGLDLGRAGAPAIAALRLQVLGVRLDNIDAAHVMDRMEAAAVRGEPLLVVNVNAHMLVLAQEQPWLRELCERADVCFCDGAGAQLAAGVLTGVRPHRHTPPEWVESLCQRLAARGGSVFWLGGAPGVVDRAAEAVAARTGIRTAGTQHGYFDHSAGSVDNAALVERINAARPDLLLVNMGMPLQERWLHDHWHLLRGVGAALTAGALVDHAAGDVKRPPQWVSDAGLEWAVRLFVEPRRLWRRYVLGLPRLGLMVAADLIAAAFGRGRSGLPKPGLSTPGLPKPDLSQ